MKQRFIWITLSLCFIGSTSRAQTAINISQVRCPSTGTTNLIIPAGIAGLIGGIPIVTFACVQLDPAVFFLDRTTTPPTMRSISSGLKMFQEIPAGAVDGINANFTLASKPGTAPILVYRNGMLLTACPTSSGSVTACNGDYQISGTAILFLAAQQTASGVGTIPSAGDLLQVIYWHQ